MGDGDSALTEFCASSRVINLNRPTTSIDRSSERAGHERVKAAACTPPHRDDDGGGGDDLGQFMTRSPRGWLPGDGGDSEVGGVEAINESNSARVRVASLPPASSSSKDHRKLKGERGTAHLRFEAQTLLLGRTDGRDSSRSDTRGE